MKVERTFLMHRLSQGFKCGLSLKLNIKSSLIQIIVFINNRIS